MSIETPFFYYKNYLLQFDLLMKLRKTKNEELEHDQINGQQLYEMKCDINYFNACVKINMTWL